MLRQDQPRPRNHEIRVPVAGNLGGSFARAIGREQAPSLSEGGELIVPTYGAFVTRRAGGITVMRKRVTLLEVPVKNVRHITLVGPSVVASTSLMTGRSDERFELSVIDRSGKPLGRFQRADFLAEARIGQAQMKTRQSRTGNTTASKQNGGHENHRQNMRARASADIVRRPERKSGNTA